MRACRSIDTSDLRSPPLQVLENKKAYSQPHERRDGPGWVNTTMGTLDDTVKAEMELEPSVRGVADVVEQHMSSGANLYLDWRGELLGW